MCELWLRLDERSNSLDNLEMCAHFLEALPDPIRWKWAIIALHQALYGFAVAAVQGTDSWSVLKDPANPNSHLVSIWTAIERARDSAYLWPGGRPLVTSEDEVKAIEKLVKEFRNGFEHFSPAAWSIEVSGMPTILERVLRVVEGVAIATRSVRYEDDKQEVAARTAIGRVRAAIGSRPMSNGEQT